jgi:hypothetical protein
MQKGGNEAINSGEDYCKPGEKFSRVRRSFLSVHYKCRTQRYLAKPPALDWAFFIGAPCCFVHLRFFFFFLYSSIDPLSRPAPGRSTNDRIACMSFDRECHQSCLPCPALSHPSHVLGFKQESISSSTF